MSHNTCKDTGKAYQATKLDINIPILLAFIQRCTDLEPLSGARAGAPLSPEVGPGASEDEDGALGCGLFSSSTSHWPPLPSPARAQLR